MSKDATYNRLIQSDRWRALRNAQLTEHPLCASCEAHGIIRSAQCVHHITPIESAKDEQEMTLLCFSPSNLQSLCYRCHAEVHKAAHSHSKAAHQERAAEALERWKKAHPGGSL